MISVYDDLETHICPGIKILALDVHEIHPWIVFISADRTIYFFNTEKSALILRKNLDSFVSDQRDEVILSKHLQSQYGEIINLPHWYYSRNKVELNQMYDKKVSRVLGVKFFDGNISFWKMHNLQEVVYKNNEEVLNLKDIHDLDERFHVEKKYVIISFTNRILMISYDEIHETVQCCKELRSQALNKQEIVCFENLCTKPIICVGCSDGHIRFWNYMDDVVLESLTIHAFSKPILRLMAINRNDPLTSEYPDLLGCSLDGVVSLWNVEHKRAVFKVKIPGNVGIADMLYQRDRDLVVVMCQDRSIAVWELESFNKSSIENRKFWNKDLRIRSDTPRILSFVSVPKLSPFIGNDFLYVGVAEQPNIYRIPLQHVYQGSSQAQGDGSPVGRPGLSPSSVFKFDLLGRAVGSPPLSKSKRAMTTAAVPSGKKGSGKGAKGAGSRKGKNASHHSSSQIDVAARKVVRMVTHPQHHDEIFVITQNDGILHFRVKPLKSEYLPYFRSCAFGMSNKMGKNSNKIKFVRNVFHLQLSNEENTLEVVRRKVVKDDDNNERISSKCQVITRFPNFEKNFLSYVHLSVSPSGRYLAVQLYEPIFQLYVYDCHNKFQRVVVHKKCRWVCFRLVDSGIDQAESSNDLCLLNVKKRIQVVKNVQFQSPVGIGGQQDQFDHVFGGRYICAVKYFQRKVKASISGSSPSGKPSGVQQKAQMRVFSSILFIDWESHQVVKKLEDVPNIPKSVSWDPASLSFSIQFVKGISIFTGDDEGQFRMQSYVDEKASSLYWFGGVLFAYLQDNGVLKCYFPNFKKTSDYEEIELTTKDIMKYSQLSFSGSDRQSSNTEVGMGRRGASSSSEASVGGDGGTGPKGGPNQEGLVTKKKKSMRIIDDIQEHVESIVSFKPLVSVGLKQSDQQILTILDQRIILFDRSFSGIDSYNNTRFRRSRQQQEEDGKNGKKKKEEESPNPGFFSISFERNIFLKFYLLVQCGRVKEALKWLEFLPNEVHVVLVEFLFKKLEFHELLGFKKEIVGALGTSLFLKFQVLKNLLFHFIDHQEIESVMRVLKKKKKKKEEEEEEEDSDDEEDMDYIDQVVLLARECVHVLNEMKERSRVNVEKAEDYQRMKAGIGEYYMEICKKLQEEMKKERYKSEEEMDNILDSTYIRCYQCNLKKFGKLAILYFVKRKDQVELKKIYDKVVKKREMLVKKKKKSVMHGYDYENEIKLLQSFLGLSVNLEEKYSLHLKFEVE